jgi:hypothetical protein
MKGNEGGVWVDYESPYVVICEVNKHSTLRKREAEAELFRQLRVLMLKQYSPPCDQFS